VSDVPEQPDEGSLLFIYAADSGLFNTMADIAHKIFSPQTYPCQLCALTHGHFRVRREWQQFIESLPVPCLFVHRDEAADITGVDVAHLPAVYSRRQGRWRLCLGQDGLTCCRNLPQLKAAIGRCCANG
jgi:hypothetical protein